ncbi:hypothetical protein V8G54_016332 [Vigna mungo]|uniref:Uncharacterized protein n=1 Tax=Vigna mungo TaxID=3915 RepID=A0AAQ3NM66_VIGMU
MPYSSVALNVLQSLYINRVESSQVSFNHVFGDLVPESDEFLLSELLCHFVIHAYITQDLSRSAPSNSMNVLQRVLDSLVVRNLHTANTSALDAQSLNLHTHLQFMFYCAKHETLIVCGYLWSMRIQNVNGDSIGEARIGYYSE